MKPGQSFVVTVSLAASSGNVSEERCEIKLNSEGFSFCKEDGSESEWFPFSELLGVEYAETACKALVYTFKRGLANKSHWYPKRLILNFASKLKREEFVSTLKEGIAGQSTRRPKKVLVIMNPASGSMQTIERFNSIVKPVFSIAGIRIDVLQTKSGDHNDVICQVLQDISLNRRDYDGILAMGGDGIFFELVNLLSKFNIHRSNSGLQCSISQIRVAHLPSGSTDAVACSINGSRSLFTASMHVALGDSMDIDALRVQIENNEPKFVCCIAAYGFMADVIQYSSGLRLFGPIRYDIVGVYTLLLNNSYRCNIKYKVRTYDQNLQQVSQSEDDIECQSECKTCRSASLSADLGESGLDEQDWKEVEDDYMSIMVINHACISEKSPFGMYRFAHLSNGSMTLITVKRCSWVQYLMFLKSMSDHGELSSLIYIQIWTIENANQTYTCMINMNFNSNHS